MRRWGRGAPAPVDGPEPADDEPRGQELDEAHDHRRVLLCFQAGHESADTCRARRQPRKVPKAPSSIL